MYVLYTFMIDILSESIATEREAMHQEKQRSIEQRLVEQYTNTMPF